MAGMALENRLRCLGYPVLIRALDEAKEIGDWELREAIEDELERRRQMRIRAAGR